jgi:soluble lytic murein transglycosylase
MRGCTGQVAARLKLLVALAAAAGAAAARAEAGPRAAPPAEAVEPSVLARYADGARRFREADYPGAVRALRPLASLRLASRDTLLYLLAASAAAEVPPETAAALGHFGELAAIAGSRHQALARARRADLLFEGGQDAAARAAYRQVLAAPPPTIDAAVARFRLGEIAARSGARAEAAAAWRNVMVEHPAHPLAERALARLRVAVGEAAAEPDARERVERARRLQAEHAWERALEELARVPADAPPAVRAAADYQIGMAHFRMRQGYDIAAETLLAVWPKLPPAEQADALFHGARAWSRADQDDRAIEGYRQVMARFPSSRWAREAHFLIGWLDFNRGRYAAALPTLEAVARRDHSSFSDDAAWFAALSRWLLGDPAGTLTALAEYQRLARGPLGEGKARYWRARALERLGRGAEAEAELRAIVDAWPLTYYAQQARVRLAAGGVRLGPFGEAAATTASDPAPAADQAPSMPALDKRLVADPRVVRVDELLAAGLPEEAAAELDRVDGALLGHFGAARVLPLVADRYQQAEDFFHLHRLGEAHAGSALRRDPRRDPAARRLWQLMYPLAWRRFVEKYAASGKNPPYYLYAIMQKESAYNPHDLSYADAIGLLQMIPPTSRRVAERIGRPYTDDVLYDPEGNIQFGAWYIGHLLAKFKGQVALGAGAYNAGPRAMMRWLQQHGARPLDELIELVPYTQTRDYMKKAIEIYARYLWLYPGVDYLPDGKVDPTWLDDGIDY